MSTLYIHIPFCEQKCFYCSFVISVGQKHRMNDYCDALIKEMKKYQGTKIQSIYFGGGTPSVLDVKNLEKLMQAIHQNFIVESKAEISFEVNPKDLDIVKAKVIQQAGINRMSVGAQTFNDDVLKYLGRVHNANDIYQTMNIIQSVGIENISLDLMFGFPQQACSQIDDDIKMMASLNPQHISLYALTIEENSRFFVKNVKLNETEIQVEQYNLVLKLMNQKRYEQYEVSNFSRQGFESRHNLNYWQGGEYIGLGIGAHSYVSGKRYWNGDKLQDYLNKMKQGESVEEGSQILDRYAQMMDRFLFGLRMNKGVNLEAIQQEYQCAFQDKVKQTLAGFQEGHFVVLENKFYKVTGQGRLVLDELCARLI